MDFLHCVPALRGLLKEPLYLWQHLSPDGRNLEHWVGGIKQVWCVCVSLGGGGDLIWEKKRGRARAITGKTLSPAEKKQMAGGGYLLLSLCPIRVPQKD